MEKGTNMRFTDKELALLKGTFKGNLDLIKLLRKIFLPEFNPYAPLGQNVDLWMTVDLRSLSPQDAYLKILARNELIMHIEQQLLQINILAEMKEETPKEKEERAKKDSTK